jgi:DUF4097 and DUF4098 domain-containing protein YvlB
MRRVFETPGGTSVVVENSVGAVELDCVETSSTEVELEASSPTAAALVDGATVTCSEVAGGHLVRVLIPKPRRLFLGHRDGVWIRLRVPVGAALDISTASADITVRGQMGVASFKSASGSIVAEDSTDDVRVATASGDITLGVARAVRAQSASGDVRVGVAGSAEVQQVSGDVAIGVLTGEASVHTVSGNVQVRRCHRGRIRVKSVSGDVTLGVPPRTTLRVDATSFSGKVSSEIPIGEGAPSAGASPDLVVAVQTMSGDVTLERAEEPVLHC